MNNYPEARCTDALSPIEESTRQRIERIRKDLVRRLTDIDEALSLLDKFPDMEKFTDVLRRI